MSQESVGENDLPHVHEEVDADLKRVEVTEARDQAKEKTQAREEVQPMFNIEDVEGVDFLQPFLHVLSPSLIELLRFCETTRARNISLSREVVLLENHVADLKGINQRLIALLESKAKTSSTTPPPSPPKEDN